MLRCVLVVCICLAAQPVFLQGFEAQGSAAQAATPAQSSPRLRIFLDCDDCYGDYIRDEVDFVEYVRDPAEADVHVLITSSGTGSGGRERALSIGSGGDKGLTSRCVR